MFSDILYIYQNLQSYKFKIGKSITYQKLSTYKDFVKGVFRL